MVARAGGNFGLTCRGMVQHGVSYMYGYCNEGGKYDQYCAIDLGTLSPPPFHSTPALALFFFFWRPPINFVLSLLTNYYYYYAIAPIIENTNGQLNCFGIHDDKTVQPPL
jgi:hypothetical protein